MQAGPPVVPAAKALTARLFEETKKHRLLIGKGGLEGNVLRISPALTVTSDEIAEAVAWLLSEKASYATGTVMRVAGGL